jgi:hypothetical protein
MPWISLPFDCHVPVSAVLLLRPCPLTTALLNVAEAVGSVSDRRGGGGQVSSPDIYLLRDSHALGRVRKRRLRGWMRCVRDAPADT